jgi:hypothetical protein
MAGLIGGAPIYANGLLSLLFVFVLPGLAFASLFRIPDFPQRWFVTFLTSLLANHLLVTLIAAFRLDPLLTYRVAACVVIIVPVVAAIVRRARLDAPAFMERSTLSASDLGWFVASLVALAITYFNVWKHGVPNIFNGGDVLVSWNAWATIWAHGNFPATAYGYPQLIPTLWAVTYIFTGSPEQYFAFYIYIGLIVLPILLNAMVLGRLSLWYPLVSGLAFIWFIAEIRTPWLRETLEQGFPDWVAAIFASCGVVLFAFSEPNGRLDREKITNALLALCLVSLAAAIKPLHGLLALALLAGISTDAWKYLKPADRNRFLIAAAGLLSVLVILYAIYYTHLRNGGIPGFPVASALEERLSRALDLLNSTFTIPFRIVFVLGLLLCPFVKRMRWFALPLYIAIATWANTSAYDLRNILSFLMIGAFVPLYVAVHRWLEPRALSRGPQWQARDGLVTAVLALATFGLTSPLAISDQRLQRRFADDQLRIDAGLEINQKIGEVLNRGCKVFSPTGSFLFIVALAPFRSQIQTYFYTLPLDDSLTNGLNNSKGCTAVLYPLDRIHPSILNFVADYARARGLKKVLESNGMELLVSDQ